MPEPFRLRILKALTAVIKTANPDTPGIEFTNDLRDYADEGGTMRSRVVRGKTDFGTEPLPLISILDHPDQPEPVMGTGGRPAAKTSWALLIQGWVEDDLDNPTDPAHVLAAGVIAVISAEREKYTDRLGEGDRVMDIRIGSPVVRPSLQGVSDAACFFLTVIVDMVEDLNRPFA